MSDAAPASPIDHDGLNQRFAQMDLAARLAETARSASGRIVFTTSLGMEDQAITHAIATAGLPIEIVTLDTGRLFEETYAVWADTEKRCGLTITPFYPDHDTVAELVAANGINGFYDSRDARKACCHVRKVEPLGRALEGAAVWITGLRADQNASRKSLAFAEPDAGRGLSKINPILDWSQADLDAYIAAHDIPVNALHARGFPSIGCAPCTRAITVGEDPRAGRWWWENEDGAAGGECGLHVGPDGKLTRTRKPETPEDSGMFGDAT